MNIEKSLTIYKLHSALKSDDFWAQFMTAIAQELEYQNDQIGLAQFFNDIYNLTEDEIIDICLKFGYTPNLVIDNSLTYTVQEAESIPFRIRNKTTYKGYAFGFKRLSLNGEIYNLYWQGTKLVKAIDWENTFIALNAESDYTIPFIQILADKNFSVISPTFFVNLDEGRFLDESPPWHLDASTTILPTKHLAIEYYLDRIYQFQSSDHLLYDDYITFYENEVEYTRRVPIVPHIGGQLVLISDESGVFNSFNTSLSYSMPDIKLKNSVTTSYINEIGGDIPSTFQYISIGIGTRGLINNANSGLYAISDFKIAYTFDEDLGTVVYDLTTTANNGTLTGSDNRIAGIVGPSINFNGSTHVITNSPVSISRVNMTYQFWFNANNTSASGTQVLVDQNTIKIKYNYTTQNLLILIDASTFTIPLLKNTPTLIQIEVDATLNSLRTYFNTVLQSTNSISGIFTAGNYTTYIGCDSSSSNHWTGILDQFYILTKFFTGGEKTYIYNNNVSLITSCSQPIYRTTLSLEEVVEDGGNIWYAAQSHLSAQSVNEEFAFRYATGTTVYTGSTRFGNLLPYYFQVNFVVNDGINISYLSVKDDGSGKLKELLTDDSTDSPISGTINYTTGEYVIDTFKLFEVLQETLATTSVNNLSTFLHGNITSASDAPITPFKLYYMITGTSYVAIDDGSGNVVGTGISFGSIDYTTGELNITFTGSTDVSSFVYCQYEYSTTLFTLNDSLFTFEYKTTTVLEITEVTLEDSNKRALVYGTFPPIKFKNYLNHVSSTFLIKHA